MTDRAVSEVIGFVLVFSLVLSSVSVVYVVGFGGLQDARDAEQLTNAERAFDVLADNMDDIHRDNAPNRATEFKLYDARIDVGDPVTFNVTVDNGTGTQSFSVDARPVVYAPTTGETTLRYLNGAVFRTGGSGSVLLNEPRFLFRESGGLRTAAFPLIETRPDGVNAIGGSTTVLIRADLARAELLGSLPDAAGRYDVTFRVETAAARAPTWERFLEAELNDAYGDADRCTVSGGTVECAFETDRLYVSATRIDVAIDS
ncbi:DUF7289 family protein [Halosegnis marinus]|uniref:Flagellin n=1 Tax=Halosegnis marinus TaxID=3034023 RepID=A0ABD5ZSC8_9EURY|nr:hypothetical protein [Halosegnis sp. DT85]